MTRLILATLIASMLSACNPEPPEILIAPPEITLPQSCQTVSPLAATQLIKDNPTKIHLIDARTEPEFAKERLPGAHHINYFNLEQARERLQDLPQDRPSLVYCTLGTRARDIALLMHELGFQNIHILEGGIHQWKQSGLPFPPQITP
jgi:rhodanese-related sulfurtransferase